MVDIGVRAEQKQICSVYIILSGGNMEGGQSPTAPGISFKEGLLHDRGLVGEPRQVA